VFQETVLDRGLSGRRNLMLHARLWRVEPRSAARHLAELVETFDLGDVIDRPVESYSGGQRRRLEIARALLSTPKVLFLDEPTVGLDTRIRYELLDIVAGLRRRTEMTTLLTTHYLDEAQRLCDRIAIVSAGRIVALDTPRGLVEALGSDILEIRVDGDPVAALALLRSREVTDGDGIVVGSTLTMPVRHRSLSATRALVEQLLPTSTLTVRPPGLDDVYLRLTGNEIAAA
jgi:ABC-2 type transport system ATP-binding protein